MKYLNTLKHNLRRSIPLFVLAGATLMPACKPDLKEQDSTDPTNPGQEQPIARHTTTYVYNNRDFASLLDKRPLIKASADSALVSKVFLESDSTKWAYAIKDVKRTLEAMLENFSEYGMADSCISKMEFSGIINTALVRTEQDRQDSIELMNKYPKLQFINTVNMEKTGVKTRIHTGSMEK